MYVTKGKPLEGSPKKVEQYLGGNVERSGGKMPRIVRAVIASEKYFLREL
jgi:hypothetical protein